MKRLLFVSKALTLAAALAFVTSSAHAGGLNLSWTDCGSAGLAARTFACASNTGSATMFLSVIAAAPMPQFNGVTSVVDLQTNQAALSDWWQLGAGGCRAGSLTGDANFTQTDVNGDPVFTKCLDIFAGAASGGINYNGGFGGANRARLKGTFSIAGNKPVNDVTEMYIMKFQMNFLKSTGAGSCTGCTNGVCIVFNELLMTQPAGVGDYRVTNPLVRRDITFQTTTFSFLCPADVPTKQATWGAVKSLYR